MVLPPRLFDGSPELSFQIKMKQHPVIPGNYSAWTDIRHPRHIARKEIPVFFVITPLQNAEKAMAQ